MEYGMIYHDALATEFSLYNKYTVMGNYPSSITPTVTRQFKASLMKRKMQQFNGWQLPLYFGVSILISFASIGYLVYLLRKHVLPVFTDRTGFGVCPLCGQLGTDMVIIPCNHFSHCYECEIKRTSFKEAVCTVCNEPYHRSIKIYL